MRSGSLAPAALKTVRAPYGALDPWFSAPLVRSAIRAAATATIMPVAIISVSAVAVPGVVRAGGCSGRCGNTSRDGGISPGYAPTGGRSWRDGRGENYYPDCDQSRRQLEFCSFVPPATRRGGMVPASRWGAQGRPGPAHSGQRAFKDEHDPIRAKNRFSVNGRDRQRSPWRPIVPNAEARRTCF
jgi:hypothetical protein